MRILHLIPTFSGGGAERQLALMARQQAETGADVSIIYHGDGPNLAFLDGSKVSLFPLSLKGNHDPRALWSIIRTIRRWKPDVVQTWLPQMDILGGLAARLMGVPHILSERASAEAYGTDWKSRLRAVIGRRADAIIANSQTGASYWTDQNARGEMHVVVNAITPFNARDGERAVNIRHPAILYAGRIAPPKNIANLVRALGIALERSKDAHAYILGTGHEEDAMRQWVAQEKSRDRFHILGYVENPHPWYCQSDMFVSVSEAEGHPNVVLEAASAGCPLILSDIPAHREAIPADGALFVDPLNPESIAAALLATLEDKTVAAQRAEASRAFVSGLSVERQAAKYLDIFHEIARKRALFK